MRSDLLADERREERRRLVVRGGAGLLAAATLVAVLHATGLSSRLLDPAFRTSAEGRSTSGASGTIAVAATGAGSGPASASPSGTAAPDGAAGKAASLSSGAAVRTRPLSAWLTDIARDAGRDLVLSPELRGDLTASESAKLGWEERLGAYARVFGFDFVVSEGLIEVRGADAGRGAKAGAGRVALGRGGGDGAGEIDSAGEPGADTATSQETVGGERAGGRATGPSSAGAAAQEKPEIPTETRVIKLAHAPAKDVAAVLAKAGEALGVVAAPDLSSNALVLSGTRASLERTQRVVSELDRPRRRVLLEAKIVEVLRSARRDLGIEWKIAGDIGGEVKFPPPQSDAGSAAVLIATGGASALDARISAMEADGRLRVVSRPSVVMIEGSPATIESVRILRIRLPSQGTVVGGEVVEAPTSGRATEDIPVGVRLEVTPAIRSASRVLLRIRAKSSSLGAPLPPDDIPEELSRMVDAEVLVANGETAVLGGLSREAGTNNGAGVPGVRRVPGLGLLFGKKTVADEQEELLILVTPRVLD